jgi:hypothetical protein
VIPLWVAARRISRLAIPPDPHGSTAPPQICPSVIRLSSTTPSRQPPASTTSSKHAGAAAASKQHPLLLLELLHALTSSIDGWNLNLLFMFAPVHEWNLI